MSDKTKQNLLQLLQLFDVGEMGGLDRKQKSH